MGYQRPSLDLLDYHNTQNQFTNREYVEEMAQELSSLLTAFKVNCTITGVRMSPFSVLFDVMPEVGVSVKKIKDLRVDLEVHMASPVEIIELGEKQFTVGLAVKNWVRPMIGLRDVMETSEFSNSGYSLPIAAGVNVLGKPFVFDLAETPHLLVAGTTGSGKSTFLNTIILSILYTHTPEEVQFVMVDPKCVELSAYNRIPHMMGPVIYDSQVALDTLGKVLDEMQRRYELFAKVGARSIESYNEVVSAEERVPRIVVIVDEYMEMMFRAPKELEAYVTRLARMSRASGIHLVLATQRPSSDVITGQIKTNIPCRASFTVVDWRESKSILDRTGAERLLGNGDMLYSAAESAIPTHAQASFVSYEEVDRVIEAVASAV